MKEQSAISRFAWPVIALALLSFNLSQYTSADADDAPLSSLTVRELIIEDEHGNRAARITSKDGSTSIELYDVSSGRSKLKAFVDEDADSGISLRGEESTGIHIWQKADESVLALSRSERQMIHLSVHDDDKQFIGITSDSPEPNSNSRPSSYLLGIDQDKGFLSFSNSSSSFHLTANEDAASFNLANTENDTSFGVNVTDSPLLGLSKDSSHVVLGVWPGPNPVYEEMP